jgi:hypothetical protein
MRNMAPPLAPAPGSARRGWSLAISDGLTVDDLLRINPVAAAVLAGRGVRGAGESAAYTLADVARRHAIALDELLDELRAAAIDDTSRFRGYGDLRPVGLTSPPAGVVGAARRLPDEEIGLSGARVREPAHL